MNTKNTNPPAVVLSTAEVDQSDPERAKRCLEALRVVLGIDSPETRGWAPIVQQEARRAIDRALAALVEQAAQIQRLKPLVPQEPVAWDTVYKAVSAATEACANATGMHRQIRLFVSKTQITNDALGTDAAPQPQRPRLTDEEIKAIEHETDMKSSIGDWSNYFARAIEAKVRGEA